MTEQTEIAVRGILGMDPEVKPEWIAQAMRVLRGEESREPQAIMTIKDVMRLLEVKRRTIDNYFAKGLLDRVYGGGARTIGVTRESFERFVARRAKGVRA